jgi:hypothetical protein
LEAVEIIGRLGGHRVLSNPKPAVYNPQLLWIYLVGRLADGNGKSRSSDKTLAASCGRNCYADRASIAGRRFLYKLFKFSVFISCRDSRLPKLY